MVANLLLAKKSGIENNCCFSSIGITCPKLQMFKILSFCTTKASIIVGKKDAAAEELREVMEEVSACHMSQTFSIYVFLHVNAGC